MEYNLLELEDGTNVLQEVSNGYLQRYCDLKGNTVTFLGGSKVLQTAYTVNFVVELPEPELPYVEPVTESRLLTKIAFMDRLTQKELEDIYTMAKQSVTVEVWLERFKLATEIDLDDPRMIAGLQTMEAVGLLSQGRSVEVLG
jgi:hypothetical protein